MVAVLEYGPHRREFSGSASATTNNRMELQAAIEAFARLERAVRSPVPHGFRICAQRDLPMDFAVEKERLENP